MIETFSKIFDLLDARERRNFFLLVGLSLVLGLVEAIGVLSILPFIAVAANPDAIAQSALLTRLYDGFGFESTQSFLIALGVVVFAVLVGGIAVRSVTFYALTRFGRMRTLSLGRKLLQRYLGQPYAWHLDRHTARLSTRVLSEVQQVVDGSVLSAMQMIAHAAVTVCIVALLFAVEPVAALAVGGVLCLAYGLVFVAVRRWLLRLGQVKVEANAQRFRVTQEALAGIKDVKLMGLEEPYLRRFSNAARRFVRVQATQALISELPRNALEALTFGAMILFVLWVLATRQGDMIEALPILGLYAFAGIRLFPALQKLYNTFARVRFGKPALDSLHADLTEPIAGEKVASSAGPALGLREAIELDGIVYKFAAADRPALDRLDLRIEARTSVGIVGATGAGKTTAVDVILGLLAPQAGEMRVDGVRIDGSNLRAWQRSVGYVPQSIYLLDDTIAANIAFGQKPEAIDRAAVERAARIAKLHDFVMELPRGYDTLIGERGARISGGQRQRVGIARALYRDPDLLVFDEATSALDNITEKAVMEAIEEIGREKTVVMIAHRLTTVRRCDVIFYLEAGSVAAAGSYDALLGSDRRFRALHEASG
jgi:ABC-type multidrug transport system fused ATPase/permease subunit